MASASFGRTRARRRHTPSAQTAGYTGPGAGRRGGPLASVGMTIDPVDLVERATRGFTAAVSTPGALALDVPSCPEWTVADLVRHLGGVQSWWEAAVRGEGAEPDRADLATLREPGDDLLGWWRDRSESFLATLNSTPIDAPVWCWWTDERRDTVHGVAWRQAHEAVVHRWDAEAATGTPTPVEPAVAADGVDEFAARFLPNDGWGAPVRLRAEDADRTWTFTPDSADPAGPVAVDLTGPAERLYLVLWRRLAPGAIEVSGDGDTLSAFLAASNLGGAKKILG